jgi:DNA-binding NtrC family response regulator
LNHTWPENIRLRNAIRRAALSRGDIITSIYINDTVNEKTEIAAYNRVSFNDSAKRAEKVIIMKAIEEAGGNKSKAARILNMNERTFYRKIKSLGIH